MINSAIRMMLNVVEDPLEGITSRLNTLEIDDGDRRPKTPKILSTTRNKEAVAPSPVTQTISIGDWPLIVIASERTSQINVPGVHGKAWDFENFPITVSYVTREPDLSKAWLDSDYTLRSVIISLRDGLFASDKQAARIRGTVSIVKYNSIEYSPELAEVSLGRIVGALIYNLHIRVRI